jgi:hypothetical protein
VLDALARTNTIVVCVVDADGTILWQGLGAYDTKLAAELERTVTTARRSAGDA